MRCKILILFLLVVFPLWSQAAVFTSADGNFTMDLPSGWSAAQKTAPGSVLSIVKEAARIDIKTQNDCNSVACIEQKIQTDLENVKSRKMQVIDNSYTGEEIKRIDFSTGDPFFYISFFTPKNDFSAGYFLIGKQAYSILAKDLSYAQTDLIFSFISPAAKNAKTAKAPAAPAPAAQTAPATQKVQLEMDLTDSRAYSIEALPSVSEQSLPVAAPAATSRHAKAPVSLKSLLKIRTLITRNMPPYIQQMGRGFDLLVVLLFVYLFIWLVAGIVRIFIPSSEVEETINPNSPYPIKFARLYGTPSLIYRAQDNLGNILTSLSTRWESLFLLGGLLMIIFAGLVMALTGILEHTGLFGLSAFVYNTIYSAVSLIIPLGFVVFICGVLWSQLILRQFTLYDRQGQKAVYVQQRGFGIAKECYLVYFVKSKEAMFLERKRFTLLHKWQLLTPKRQVFAYIEEDSLVRAIFRRLVGHLWGFLRAGYTIKGPMDSTGYIHNARVTFNRFTCQLDKPQALSARNALVAALIINIRDRDKWYPWF